MPSNRSKMFSEKTGHSGQYHAGEAYRNNEIGRKIQAARKKAGLSCPAFSKKLSEYGLTIQGGGIVRWESGAVIPNAYQLLAVCRALHLEDGIAYFTGEKPAPELNLVGMRKLEDYKEDLIASGRYQNQSKKPVLVEYIEMPVSSLVASAGTGEFLEEGNFDLMRFPAAQVPPEAEFGIRIAGDSMEPVYHDGEIAWVQLCQSLRVGEVGIFVYDGEGYIKEYGEQEPDEEFRLAYEDGDGNVPMQPVLISYNEAYTPKVVNPYGGFRIIGRVLH